MKTILHVGLGHRPYDTRIFEKECSSLSKNGFDVIYVTSSHNGKYRSENKNGVQIYTLDDCENQYRIKKFISRMRKNKQIKKRYLDVIRKINPDIVHIHESSLRFLIFSLKNSGKYVIYDCHEDNAGNTYTYFLKFGRFVANVCYLISKKLEQRACRQVDCIIAATDHIGELAKEYARNTQVEIIRNYPILRDEIDTSFLKNDNSVEKIICYIGDCTRARKLERMSYALAELNDSSLRLVVAGDISEEYQKEMLAIYPNTIFLGYLSQIDIRHLLQASCIGMCVLDQTVNVYQSLPIKLFEYMREGLPVICSNFPLWRSIVQEDHCGICVDCDNIGEIANAIKYIVNNPKEASKMGVAGRRAILTKYNWNIEEKKLLELYHNIV